MNADDLFSENRIARNTCFLYLKSVWMFDFENEFQSIRREIMSTNVVLVILPKEDFVQSQRVIPRSIRLVDYFPKISYLTTGSEVMALQDYRK